MNFLKEPKEDASEENVEEAPSEEKPAKAKKDDKEEKAPGRKAGHGRRVGARHASAPRQALCVKAVPDGFVDIFGKLRDKPGAAGREKNGIFNKVD